MRLIKLIDFVVDDDDVRPSARAPASERLADC